MREKSGEDSWPGVMCRRAIGGGQRREWRWRRSSLAREVWMVERADLVEV